MTADDHAHQLRAALDAVVTKITWRSDHTALVHDSEALNTLIGCVVMVTAASPTAPGLDVNRDILAGVLFGLGYDNPGRRANEITKAYVRALSEVQSNDR